MASAPADHAALERPTIQDLTGDNRLAQLARKYWLSSKSKVKKVQPNVVKEELWDELEKEHFPHQQLLLLEQLQLLDRYLWPGYGENASDQHVLLIALLVNVKRAERVNAWGEWSGNLVQNSTNVNSCILRRPGAFPVLLSSCA